MRNIQYTDIEFLRIDDTELSFILENLIECKEDRYRIVIEAIQKERDFMRKHEIFFDKIKRLCSLTRSNIRTCEIKLLQEIFSVMDDNWRNDGIILSKLPILSDGVSGAIIDYLLSKDSNIYTHVYNRTDKALFPAIKILVENNPNYNYEHYKKIVFKHACSITTCYNNVCERSEPYDPFKKVYDNYGLTDTDYRELQKKIWCNS